MPLIVGEMQRVPLAMFVSQEIAKGTLRWKITDILPETVESLGNRLDPSHPQSELRVKKALLAAIRSNVDNALHFFEE